MSTPFPTLMAEAPEPWRWPVPPFSWRHRAPPGLDVAQPCRIEGPVGTPVVGELLGFDSVARTLRFRSSPDGLSVSLAFNRMRRLTLTDPLQPAMSIAGAPVERVPSAAQEREYRLQGADGRPPLTGRTAGQVETSDGLYLYTPVEDEMSLQRVFVPRTAYSRCEYGPSAQEVAAQMWIASPRELLVAIDRQERMPVLPLGQSLLALGLLTPAQLERELARPRTDVPLGEALVKAGMITRSDLQTALAHKMGYPLVDLARFPIDPRATAKLPQRIAIKARVMPLLLDGDRLIVAVDKPARVQKLRMNHAFMHSNIAPVLASKTQLLTIIDGLTNDVWSERSVERQRFFSTTV